MHQLTRLFAILLFAPALLAQTPAEVVTWTNGISYTYDGSGNIRQIGNDVFVYDDVGRLVQAEVNGVRRNYGYDAFGNRTGCTQAGSDCQFGVRMNAADNRNRLADVTYDASGNVTDLAGHHFSYDAVNMTKRDDFGGLAREFLYTADDERIATYTVGSSWQWTVRETSGKVLREFTSQDGPDGTGTASWKWTKDHVWRDGQLLASRQPEGIATTTYHYHLDHLGSPRRITDQTDRTVGFHDYYAFGPDAGGQDEPSHTRLKYTGHERDVWLNDTLGTLDYMHARYYSADLGRFLSVDPVLDVKKAMLNPQGWNRYSYADNSPLRNIDPDGRRSRDIIVVPVTIVLATEDKDLQHRVQRSLAQAQSFFAHADIHFSVTRVQANVSWEGTALNGTVTTSSGRTGVGEFLKNTGGLVVLVGESGNFGGLSGATKGLGGPTAVGTDVNASTLSDELAHALGNVAPGVDALSKADPILGGFYQLFANAVTDGLTDVQEGRVAIGLGLQSAYEQMLRSAAEQVVCSGTNGPCNE